MAKKNHEPDHSDSALGAVLSSLSSVEQSRRGRPSRKKIEMMIAASRSPLAPLDRGPASANIQPVSKVETLLGTGSLLNPDIRVEFVESMKAARFAHARLRKQESADAFSMLFDFIDQMVSQHADYNGLVTANALTALGVNQQALKSFIRRKHGYDVYFCNLDIEGECLHVNQWQQVIASEPSFEWYARRFLDASGLGADLLTRVVPSSVLANYSVLIGSTRFWTELKNFIQHALQGVQSAYGCDAMVCEEGDYRNELSQCLMVEFIRRSTHLKSFKFKSTGLERRLNGFMQEMRIMKDLACKSKSAWLLSCWSNYQALYLAASASGGVPVFSDSQACNHYTFF